MKNRKGFTFIELCIAVVIFSVVAIAVYSCFTTGMLAWKKTESSSCLYQDARVTLELMAYELRNSLASDKWIFEGQAKEMGFVLLASPPLQKKSAFGNIYKVRYYLEDDKLMRHQKDLKALLGEGGTESASEELIQNVKSLNLEYRYIKGGMLAQEVDQEFTPVEQWEQASGRKPSPKEMKDLQFAWKVAKFVKSNAIVYARDRMTIGVGAGQMARVISAKIAGIKAAEEGLEVKGSVMASDAFFPFRDSIDSAAEAGITAIIQPGGSMRDQEVIDAANEHGMAMILTGMRHFRH